MGPALLIVGLLSPAHVYMGGYRNRLVSKMLSQQFLPYLVIYLLFCRFLDFLATTAIQWLLATSSVVYYSV